MAAPRPGRRAARRLASSGLVTGDHGVGERPDRLLGGVGHHGFKILDADPSAIAGPEREPLEFGAEADWAGPESLDQEPRGRRLQVEAELPRVRDQLLRQLALSGLTSNASTSPPAFSTAFASPAGALPAPRRRCPTSWPRRSEPAYSFREVRQQGDPLDRLVSTDPRSMTTPSEDMIGGRFWWGETAALFA